MSVTNRKMFNRAARNKVRQMGGIMASSEPLIQEVARFQPGGSVFSPRAGDKMLGVTLGGIGGRATEGTQMTGSTLRNLLSAPNAAEIEQRLLSNFEADVSRQRLNNILEKADILGLRSDRNIANFSDVFNFVQEVNPNFKFTQDAFNKLYGEGANAATRGEFLTNVLKGIGIMPSAVGVDVAKGVSDFLGGFTNDQLLKFASGELKRDGVDMSLAAQELFEREVKAGVDPNASAKRIKDVTGFDVKALAAMSAQRQKGIEGLLTSQPGITVKDPEGLMASERAGQPPLSMTAADVRAAENRGIRAAEDALLQSRNVVDPQTSQGTDIQAILQGLESKFRPPPDETGAPSLGLGVPFDPEAEDRAKAPGEREFRKQQEEQIYADAVARDRAEAAEAAEAESEREFRKRQEKLIYEEAQGAEGRAEIAGESAEALGGDPSKAQASYNNLGLRLTTGDAGADDPRIKRIMDEFIGNIDEYDGLDSGLAIAKIGFMMAAGESPNAIVNIANALSKGADMFLKDDKERRAFQRQVDLAALQYSMGEVSKIRQQARTDERTFTDFVDKDGNAVRVSTADYLRNGGKLPEGLMDKTMYTTIQKAIIERDKEFQKLKNDQIKAMRLSPEQQGALETRYRGFYTAASEAETAGTLIETVMMNSDEIVGGMPAVLQTGANFLAIFGADAPEGWNNQKIGVQNLKAALQSVVPATLGKTQSANSISNRDVELLIQAFLGEGGIMSSNGDGTYAFLTTSKEAFLNSLKNGLRAVRKAQAEALNGMSSIENQLRYDFYTTGGRRFVTPGDASSGLALLAPFQQGSAAQFGATAKQGVTLDSLVRGQDDIFTVNPKLYEMLQTGSTT